MADQHDAKDGHEFQQQPGQDQRHAFEQRPRRGPGPSCDQGRLDIASLGAGDRIIVAAQAAVRRVSRRSADASPREPALPARGWAAASRGEAHIRRQPAQASTRTTRQATSASRLRAMGLVTMTTAQPYSSGRLCTVSSAVHRLVADPVDEFRRGKQDLGAQAVGRERDIQALNRRLGRRRFSRFGRRRRSGRCGSGLRLDDRVQGRGEGGTFGRIVQHIQRHVRLVGGDRRWSAGFLRVRWRWHANDDHAQKKENEANHSAGTTTDAVAGSTQIRTQGSCP